MLRSLRRQSDDSLHAEENADENIDRQLDYNNFAHAYVHDFHLLFAH